MTFWSAKKLPGRDNTASICDTSTKKATHENASPFCFDQAIEFSIDLKRSQSALVGFDWDWNDIDSSAALIEQNCAFAKCEQSEVFAHADVSAWMPLGPALTSKNVACKHSFATEFLDPAALSC